MKNRLQLFLNSKEDNYLTKEQEETITHDIEIINFKRMKLILIILLFIEILFIFLNDIPNLRNGGTNVTWNDKRYFVLHLLLLIIAFAGIKSIKILIKKDNGQMKKIYKFIVPGLTMAILVLISIINGLDQIKIGNTGSVFIANILICGSVLLIRFPMGLIIYSVPFCTFIAGLVIFQKDTALLVSNIINGSIFFAAVIIVSKVVYESHFIQMSRNILLEEVNRKLDYMSNHDPLTGLFNRRYFEIQAQEKMEMMSYDEKAVLLIIDLDYFKNINDQFGHPIGDMVLKEISSILLENIKDTDLATRWGGEEFLILLFHTSIEEAYKLSDKIRAAIENKTIEIEKFKIHITASIGAAQLRGDFSESFEAAYESADQALYQAKKQGRNQVSAVLG